MLCKIFRRPRFEFDTPADHRLPEILCVGTQDECADVIAIAKLVDTCYCLGVADDDRKPRKRRSPEAIAAMRRKAIEKRAVEKGGLFAEEFLQRELERNAKRLDIETIRAQQKEVEELEAKCTARVLNAMTPAQARDFLLHLPAPFISDFVDVWHEYRRTKTWTPRMRQYIDDPSSPEWKRAQASIRSKAFGKEKSESDLLKLM